MLVRGFHSAWITIKGHRILLECRSGFPGEIMEFTARLAVEICDNRIDSSGRARGKKARVVGVYFNDKAYVTTVTMASTEKEDCELEGLLTDTLGNIFQGRPFDVQVIIVERGNETSDSYDHMEYLSSKVLESFDLKPLRGA